MIACGSSLRGLSEVTIGTSLPASAARPISGRLARSRSPPQPKTQITRPSVSSARGEERAGQRVGRVRIVDDDQERLTLVDWLEPAGDPADARHAACDRLVREAEQLPGGHGREHVLDVEATEQRRRHVDPADTHPRSSRADLEPLGAKVGIGRVDRERRERRNAQDTELLGEPASVWIVDVDGRGRRLVGHEQAALGVVVRLHRAVQVEVVLAQVREREHREADAGEALQLRTMRGRLERAAPVTGVEHLPEDALEVDRLRRRPDGWPPLAADPGLDRAEQSRPPPRRGQHREEQERGGRLPVRPRHSGDGQVPRRIVEEGDRRAGHRRAGVGDDELRPVDVDGTFDDERDRAVRDRLRGDVVTVEPPSRHAEEERARLERSRVVGEVEHIGRGWMQHLRRTERRDEPLEVH